MSTIPAAALNDDFPMMLEVEVDSNTGMQRQKCPPVSVGFGYQPKEDKAKSKEAGHPVFRDVEYVRIAIPGDKNSLYFNPATDADRKRFPNAYQAFKNRSAEVKTGLPVEQWAAITRSTALTLRACHIHTVEDLAVVHEGQIDKLGFNARELRAKAQAWLASAKEGAEATKIASEKQALEDRLKAMEAQFASLNARLSPQERKRLEAEGAARPVVAPVGDVGGDVEQDVVAAARRQRARA